MRNEDMVARVIEELEFFRKRPGIYVRPVDTSHVEAFLQGVDVALGACGIALDHRSVWKARGWEDSPTTIGQRMQSRGDDTAVIVNELIDLMVEALKRRR